MTITRKFFQHSKVTSSESDIPMDNYKPGGTMTNITGKWQSRVSAKGSDESGLGRWSYFKISSNKHSIIIITAYRPCVSQGPSMAWMQQWALLRESGTPNPDPIKKFYSDLESFIQGWIDQKSEIILMMDANESIGEKPGGMSSVVGCLGLIDLIRDRHPPKEQISTYSRGSKQIDYIFGTKKVQECCTRAGILPFGMGYPSDHRALFIKVNMGQILQMTIKAIDSITARKLTQATPREQNLFLEEVDKNFSNQNLYQRLRKLAEVRPDEWNKTHEAEYEQCDRQMIDGMLKAENWTKKIPHTSWSPKFAAAVNKKSFWKVALSLCMTHKRPSSAFLEWAEQLNVQDFNSLSTMTIKQAYRSLQRELKEVESKAEEL
jgi:hypothetical protein